MKSSFGEPTWHTADFFDGLVHIIDDHSLLGPAEDAPEGSDVARGCDNRGAYLGLQTARVTRGAITVPCRVKRPVRTLNVAHRRGAARFVAEFQPGYRR
jgi:hypothetical protein